tara:strand:- start:856 stop:1467 length:612 start_codon:yes stop_codon:yes gene_type:complete
VSYQTKQEEFWASEFGDEYVNRNQIHLANIPLFTKIISRTVNVESIIEFGPNIGLNLMALRSFFPKCKLTGVEINVQACDHLREWGECNVVNQSILDYSDTQKYDLSMTKGVLIHINPNMLSNAYETLYESSNKYILVAEYYNRTPVSIKYRDHNDRLFKRDFAGEILDKYPDLTLVDYGFVYHRDNNFPKDDLSWFLLEKKF